MPVSESTSFETGQDQRTKSVESHFVLQGQEKNQSKHRGQNRRGKQQESTLCPVILKFLCQSGSVFLFRTSMDILCQPAEQVSFSEDSCLSTKEWSRTGFRGSRYYDVSEMMRLVPRTRGSDTRNFSWCSSFAWSLLSWNLHNLVLRQE